MQYLKCTHVDAVTRIPVTDAATLNGSDMPRISGLEFVFANESMYPTEVPHLYCTAPNDVDVSDPGVLAVLSEDNFFADYKTELKRRCRLKTAQVRVDGISFNGGLLPTFGDIPQKVRQLANDIEVDSTLSSIDFEVSDYVWISLSREDLFELNRTIIRKQHKLNSWCKKMHDKITDMQLDITCLENAMPILEEINTYTGIDE